MHFGDRLYKAVHDKDSCLLLGVDPDISRIPDHLQAEGDPLAAINQFCSSIIEAVKPYICGIKIQMSWFEIFGARGIALVERLASQAHSLGLIVVIDGKRSDIGSSASAYAKAYLDRHCPVYADALTINPWLGSEGMEPFVAAAKNNKKGVFVLVKTSNTSADQLQQSTAPMVADMINDWNQDILDSRGFGTVGAVVGATRGIEELVRWRQYMPRAWLLSPGVGTQGGDIHTIASLRDESGSGVLIPVSRTILYAGSGEDFADKSGTVMASYWRKQAIAS